MENQCSHFNTLSSRFILRFWVNKGSVRHTTGSSINLRIKAFNKSHQIRSLAIAVIPLNIRIWLDAICLTLAVRVNESDRYKVTIRDGVCICHGQWVLQDGLDWTPDVDDLVSALKELGCLIGEMVGDSALRRGVGLIDVYALDRSAKLGTDGSVGLATADGVIEDEDAGGSRAVQSLLVSFEKILGFRGFVRVF